MSKFPPAYAFRSDLSLEGMLAALNAAGPWQWQARESDYLGDYVSTRPEGSGARLRIAARDAEYVMDIVQWPDAETNTSREDIERVLQERIFPVLKADGIHAAESLD